MDCKHDTIKIDKESGVGTCLVCGATSEIGMGWTPKPKRKRKGKKFNIARPSSYSEPRQSCINCKHVFFTMEYEACASYYCMYKARRRPLCGSVMMHESFLDRRPEASEKQRDRTFSRRMRAWEKWSEKRGVDKMGICDHYEFEAPRELTAAQVFGATTPSPWKR
jgi:hypothetical protein